MCFKDDSEAYPIGLVFEIVHVVGVSECINRIKINLRTSCARILKIDSSERVPPATSLLLPFLSQWTSSIAGPKPGLPHPSSPPAPVPCHSPKPPCSAIFSGAVPVPAWLRCLPSVWCCDKGLHGSRNDTVSPSPSRCSDRDCLNSILSRGRVPWQLHKYLPAAAMPLRLRRARLQATSAMFFFCPFFRCLSQL